MSDPAILFVRPQAIGAKDKKALKDAGVIVVEVADPTNVKFTRAAAEISGGELLVTALRAMANRQDKQIYEFFGKELSDALLARTKQEP